MQIKVLVAEDEAPIMRSICASIQRVNPNFVVVATAPNGKKAMQCMAQEPDIQVVFLDINMPMVNGIQFLQHLQENYPNVLPVVLSGYQNFEYAQQALKYGAKAYMLKPLRSKELGEVLDDLQAQVIAQNEVDIARLLQDDYREEHLCCGQDGKMFMSAVFIGSFRMRPAGRILSERHLRTEAAFRQFLDGAYGEGNYCLATDGKYAAKILSVNQECEQPWHMLAGLFETLRADVFEVPVTIILRKAPVLYRDVLSMHYLMRLFSWREMLFSQSAIFWLPEDAAIDTLQEPEHEFEALFACVNEQMTKEEALELYKNALQLKARTRTEVLLLTKCFFHAVFSVPARETSYFAIENDVMDTVENTYSKEALMEQLKQLLDLHWKDDTSGILTKEKLAQMMEQYLQTNMEQPISLETLEKRFGYTAAYLRDIFRAQYEVSPQEYLLQLRIERARQMLKAGLSAKSVAQAVGFADPLYFSKVFKKQTGFTPSAYKQSAEL